MITITNELHLPSDVLANAVEQFAQQGDRTLVYALGLSRIDNRRQWLVQPRQDPAAPHGCWLRIVAGLSPAQLRERIARVQSSDASRQRSGIILGLGIQTAAGYLAAVGHFADGAAPLERVVLVGPGLLQVPLSGGIGTVPPGDAAGPGHDPFRSRTVGALGVPTVRRLQRLSVTVVGCGRLGSLVVAGLVPLGIQRLYLVDPDVLEAHNLGEMSGVALADIGRPKAEILAAFADRIALDGAPTTEPVVASVLALESLYAVKRSDLLISCPDNATARLASAVLATIYLKPLLDIGTGVIAHHDGRRMGADVRLLLPGRCLGCFGGIAGLGPAARGLLRGASPPRTHAFAAERLGSLRSLNTAAAGLAQLLLEHLAASRLAASAWLQLDVDDAGMPHLIHRPPPPPADCPICALAAQGDAGLEALPPVLQRLAA